MASRYWFGVVGSAFLVLVVVYAFAFLLTVGLQ